MGKDDKLEYQRRIRDTKGIAQRLDLNYLNRPALLALLRRRLTWALLVVCAAAAIPLVTGVAGGRKALMNGPVSSAHALFADRCESCHSKAFGGVPDQSCKACHDGAPHPAKSIDTAHLNAPPCAQCHLEHQGKAELAQVGDGNCTACHAGRPVRVSAFRAGKHPDFSTAKMTDTRPLKLNHAIHMPSAHKTIRGITLPMKCSDCHVTDRNSPTGDFFPVTFEQNCKSCHARELEFDVDHVLGPNAPPAPHTRDAKTIREYVEAAYRAAHANPAAAEDYLFNRKCVYCHTPGQSGWPVQVGVIHGRFPTGDPWFARGEFNHRRHRAVACESCHTTTRASTKTSDVLIPRMDTCLPCHTDSRAGLDRCALCHLYHNRSLEKEPLQHQLGGTR